MKTILILIAVLLSIAGCSSTPAKVAAPVIREQTIGYVTVTYDDKGEWSKIVSAGTAPVHNNSAHAVSEAAKVASMHAKQNIADFMSNDFHSEKTAEIKSNSKVHAGKGKEEELTDSDITTLTAVVERIRDNSSAILRGVYVTEQTTSENFVKVEVATTKQSIAAAQAIQNSMSGAQK